MTTQRIFIFTLLTWMSSIEAATVYPLNINGFSGSVRSRELNQKLEFSVDLSGAFLSKFHSVSMKLEVKKGPFRYGYDADPCRSISFFDTWWSSTVKRVTLTNDGKIQNVSFLTEAQHSHADILGYSALMTFVNDDNTSSAVTCVNLIPHTKELKIWLSLLKGPNVVGNVYFLQLHSTVRMVQFLSNANRGVTVEPLNWALVGQWDRQADSYDNPDRCDGNALKEVQRASLYNNTGDTEGIRILGNPTVIPITFDMTSLPEESDLGNGTVLVLSEVPRFGVSKDVLAVGCSAVLSLKPMVATADFINIARANLKLYQSSPFHLLQAKLSLDVKEPKLDGKWKFVLHSYPLFMDDSKSTIKSQLQCDLNFLGSPYIPLGNANYSNSAEGFFALEPELEPAEHLMWIGGFSLFGQKSIMWRSIAIYDHHNNVDVPLDCTTVRPSNRLTFAEATFQYPIAGRIIFSQEYNRPLAPVTIHVDLTHMFYNDFTESQWHLYPGKVKEDLDSLTCANVFTRILNPDAMDARNCETRSGHNCPMGFLSGKFGPVVINPYESLLNGSLPRAQFLATDLDLKLIGTNKITDAVIYLDWKWAKACANITIKSPTTARFFVKTDDVIRPVLLQQRYGQAEFAVQSKTDVKEMAFAQPLEVGYKETCETKDLGARVKVQFNQDVIGKSVAFNSSQPGHFTDCSRVDFAPATDVRSRYALAKLAEHEGLKEYVRFEQPDVGDGQKLPTVIDYHREITAVPITNKRNSRSLTNETYEWFITDSCNDSCRNTKDVFNPFFLNDSFLEYSQLCGIAPEFFCMTGDLTRKVGRLNPSEIERSHGYALFSLVVARFLPLFGDYSIVDKALIIRDQSSFCSCATIVPLEMQEMPIFTKVPMTSEKLLAQLTRSYYPVQRWQTDIQPYTKLSDTCYKHPLRFMGTTINDLTKFRTHVKGLFSKKGSVFKHSCNSGAKLIISSMLLSVFLCVLFLCN